MAESQVANLGPEANNETRRVGCVLRPADLASGVQRRAVMPSRASGLSARPWWVWAMVLGVGLLTLAAGLCLFDGDYHRGANDLVPDICLVVVVASLAVVPLVRLLAAGWAVSRPAAAAYVVARYILDPPPRSHLFL